MIKVGSSNPGSGNERLLRPEIIFLKFSHSNLNLRPEFFMKPSMQEEKLKMTIKRKLFKEFFCWILKKLFISKICKLSRWFVCDSVRCGSCEQFQCNKIHHFWSLTFQNIEFAPSCFFKWVIRGLFYFRPFQTNKPFILHTKIMWKNVHPVSSAGIRTHNLLNVNFLPTIFSSCLMKLWNLTFCLFKLLPASNTEQLKYWPLV